ncbi:MAG TPA: hypothetical protein VIK01_19160, partial [Polyangiaceae bacterium]
MTGHAARSGASRSSATAFDSSELLGRMARDLGRIASSSPFVALTWPVPQVPSERLLGAESDGD